MPKLLSRIVAMNEKNEKVVFKNMVKGFYDIPRNGWSYHCGI